LRVHGERSETVKPRDAFKALKVKAKACPGAWEDHPWGETVYKVGKKVFVFMGVDNDDGTFGLSCKLPDSHEAAITMFSFAAPTGYGLGKAGWVSARFGKKDDVPVGLLEQWIAESYAAVAPKRAKARPPKAKSPARRKRA
jgi:predicted DNA-binding protein (MmcQ/YjbR family)